MPTNQLGGHLPAVLDAILHLNKSLYILDIAGLSIAAIHVDAAIHSVNDELSKFSVKRSKIELSKTIDFSTLDEMALSLFPDV